MKNFKVEIGERYPDKSGWERRVLLDLDAGILELEIRGGKLTTHPREIPWLLKVIKFADDSTMEAP